MIWGGSRGRPEGPGRLLGSLLVIPEKWKATCRFWRRTDTNCFLKLFLAAGWKVEWRGSRMGAYVGRLLQWSR